MCTEAIQKVHHSGQAHDGSGWGPFWSEIFADGAIFVDADVGSILEETVKRWEMDCVGLFGMGIINRERMWN